MKMNKTDFEKLKALITPMLTPENIERYETGDFVRSEMVKDLNVRFRWDLFWAIPTQDFTTPGIGDTHIYTALRKIVPPIKRRY